jgi:hypothetical protein
MKKFVMTLLALALLALSSLAYIYPLNSWHEGTVSLKARDKASGKPLWQSTVRTVRTTFNGQPYLYVIEEGQGKYGSDGKMKSWQTESYSLIEDKKLVPYQVKQVFKGPSGLIIGALQKDYDRKGKTVTCQINGRHLSYPFQADLIDKEILGLYVEEFPFGNGREVPFHLMTNEPSQYKISLKDLGRETITVDGRAYECNKLQLLLDMGAINIFSGFFPKTYFWVSVSEPHEIIRYEGLESALGTPYIVLDISK